MILLSLRKQLHNLSKHVILFHLLWPRSFSGPGLPICNRPTLVRIQYVARIVSFPYVLERALSTNNIVSPKKKRKRLSSASSGGDAFCRKHHGIRPLPGARDPGKRYYQQNIQKLNIMKAWKRSGKFNRHHIKAKSRGGDSLESNLLRMDTNRHDAWHLLFGNLTIEEIIVLLDRVDQTKKRKRRRWNL